MLVIFLITSVGFSFGVHHCDSSHENEIFFFTQDYKCKTELEKPKCCCAHKSVVENKCCSNSHLVLKMNVEYSVQQISSQQTILYISDLVSFTELNLIDSKISETEIFFYRPPPNRLSGKQMVLLYHSFKIPAVIS
jgi:CRISPR/Cas system CMR-associated protein Cmr3 (group 5 of RAMP superfamily)